MRNNEIKWLIHEPTSWHFVLLTSIYSVVCSYMLVKMFELNSLNSSLFIGSVVIYLALIKVKQEKLYTYFGICLLVAIPLSLKSLTVIYNEFAAYLAWTKGYYIPQFVTTTSAIPASILFMCIIGLALYKTLEKRLVYPYILSFIFVIAWQVYMEQSMSFLLNSSLFIILLGVLLTAKFSSRKNLMKESFLLICIAVLLVASSLFIPKQQSNLHMKTVEAIQKGLYNRQPIDWKTDGDMTKISKSYMTNKVALTLVMEQPTAMYLKGFIGSQYEGNRWTTLSNRTYYHAQPLLETLKKNGLMSETMLANTYRQTVKEEEPTTVRVFPKHASKKYSYSPYELLTASESTSFQRDGLQIATTWSKASSYNYQVMNKAGIMYPVTAQLTKTDDFIETEAHYNEFVYKNYVQLTNADKKIIESHYTHQVKNIQTYDEAIEVVQKYLQNNLRFEKNTQKITKDESFIDKTLEQTKRGFSPHYATIATLVFRDLHIPARYVEGYIVTKEAVKNKKSYEEISVSGKEAHAWPEIYIDQLGWVPVEVTPGFEKKMPKLETPIASNQSTSMASSSQAQSIQTSGEQVGEKESLEDYDTQIDPQPKKVQEKWPTWLKWSLVSIVLFIILVVTVCMYVYRNRKIVRNLKKVKQSPNIIQQTQAKFALIEWQFEQILKVEKTTQSLYSWLEVLPKNYTRAMKQLITEYQKIVYGTFENTNDFERYIQQIQNSLNKPLSKWKRFIYYCKGKK